MGQMMSLNDDLIHSMKKMRLSSCNTSSVRNKDINVIRILDVPSPTSPIRKRSIGDYDVMKYAVNAPLDTDCISDSEVDETSLSLVGDTPILDSE